MTKETKEKIVHHLRQRIASHEIYIGKAVSAQLKFNLPHPNYTHFEKVINTHKAEILEIEALIQELTGVNVP